jgi:hypothetical protein
MSRGGRLTVVNQNLHVPQENRIMGTKVYTFAQRLSTGGFNHFVHVTDEAFTSNAKCTTAKRAAEDVLDCALVNWSYRMADGQDAPESGKVYTIQQKVIVMGEPIYVQVSDDVAYRTKKEAQKALKVIRSAWSGEPEAENLVIYSFKVNEQVPLKEFAVTVTVMARTQEEADALAESLTRPASQGAAVAAD